MRGLIEKTFRETFGATVAFAVGFAVAEGLLAYAIPTMILPYGDQFLQMKFLQPFLIGLLGERVEGAFERNAVVTLAWVDPVVFAIVWAHAIWFCSRVPAGEIDRGTIDVLLGLPVSRTRVFISESIVLAAGGMVVILCGLAGNWIATWFLEAEFQGAVRTTCLVAANLYCVYLAAAGVVLAASAACDRRGRAVGASLAVMIASFLVSFLAQLWEPFHRVRWLSVLNYYRPLGIVRDHAWPLHDMRTLLGVGLAFWLVGAVVFARRDVRTV
jgi:beta-exotoxin I transport system permease protein